MQLCKKRQSTYTDTPLLTNNFVKTKYLPQTNPLYQKLRGKGKMWENLCREHVPQQEEYPHII